MSQTLNNLITKEQSGGTCEKGNKKNVEPKGLYLNLPFMAGKTHSDSSDEDNATVVCLERVRRRVEAEQQRRLDQEQRRLTVAASIKPQQGGRGGEEERLEGAAGVIL